MTNILKYMVVHRDPTIPWSKVEQNWGKLANVESATWVRTCYNKEKGVRYCIWLAPNEKDLQKVFTEGPALAVHQLGRVVPDRPDDGRGALFEYCQKSGPFFGKDPGRFFRYLGEAPGISSHSSYP